MNICSVEQPSLRLTPHGLLAEDLRRPGQPTPHFRRSRSCRVATP
jgi:hypothetical protein